MRRASIGRLALVLLGTASPLIGCADEPAPVDRRALLAALDGPNEARDAAEVGLIEGGAANVPLVLELLGADGVSPRAKVGLLLVLGQVGRTEAKAQTHLKAVLRSATASPAEAVAAANGLFGVTAAGPRFADAEALEAFCELLASRARDGDYLSALPIARYAAFTKEAVPADARAVLLGALPKRRAARFVLWTMRNHPEFERASIVALEAALEQFNAEDRARKGSLRRDDEPDPTIGLLQSAITRARGDS